MNNIHCEVCERILEHFKDNTTLTRAEFWKLYEKEANNRVRRDMAEMFYGELEAFDHTDLALPI